MHDERRRLHGLTLGPRKLDDPALLAVAPTWMLKKSPVFSIYYLSYII